MVTEIICKVAVVTFSVTWISFVVDEITFKIASVADISLFVAKINFVVGEITLKVVVVTSSRSLLQCVTQRLKWL